MIMMEMFLSVYLIQNRCVVKEICVTRRVFIKHYWKMTKKAIDKNIEFSLFLSGVFTIKQSNDDL